MTLGTRAHALLAAYERRPRTPTLMVLLREILVQLFETKRALDTLTQGVELLTEGVVELRRKASQE